jgi:hypothetical protein
LVIQPSTRRTERRTSFEASPRRAQENGSIIVKKGAAAASLQPALGGLPLPPLQRGCKKQPCFVKMAVGENVKHETLAAFAEAHIEEGAAIK